MYEHYTLGMFCKIDFKGPLGLLPCVLVMILCLAAQSHAQPVQNSTETQARIDDLGSSPTPPVAAPPKSPATAYSMYEGRPASVVINSIEIQGELLASDPTLRSWAQRVTPITIRYPGIDLASGVFQDKAFAQASAFNNWLAEKWIDRNRQCNNVFQRDPKHYAWEESANNIVPQCAELNRPIQDLYAACEAPSTAQYSQATLRLRWACTLASNTAPRLYEEAIPSPHSGAIAAAVNPVSKERSRIPIETIN